MGLVLFARMVPSAFVAPFVAVVGDRYRRERILLVVHVVRAVACRGAAAALALGSATVVVYALAVLAAVPLAAHRPCHLALAPLLARTPREARGLECRRADVRVDRRVARTRRPPSSSPCRLPRRLRRVRRGLLPLVRRRRRHPPVAGRDPGPRGSACCASCVRERELARNRPVRLLVALFGAQAFVRGALGVLLVVVAIESPRDR